MTKTLLLKTWLVIILFAIASATANAATVWKPTDADSNLTLLKGQGTFGIFDDTADLSLLANSTTSALLTFGSMTTLNFALLPSGDYRISIKTNTATLSNSNYFQLGHLGLAGWSSVASFTKTAKIYSIKFNDGSSLKAIDVSAVPLPASIWMMTSALFAVLYAGKRKIAEKL